MALGKLPDGWYYAARDGQHVMDHRGNWYAVEYPTPTLPVQMRESSPPVKAAVKTAPKPASVPTPKPKARPRSVAPSQQALAYLRSEVRWLQHEPIEHTVVFSLTESGDVCGCTRIQGEATTCDMDGAQLIREARGHGAVSVIVLHNHPHRHAAEPNAIDDHSTETLREAFAAASIGLFDHFIVSSRGHIHSYRESAMEPESVYEQRERESARLWAPYSGRPSYA